MGTAVLILWGVCPLVLLLWLSSYDRAAEAERERAHRG